MKKKMIKRSLFFICLLLSSSVTHAQMDSARFRKWIKGAHLEFQLPVGYQEVNSKEIGRFYGRILYKILNQEKDILVGLSALPNLGDVPDRDLEFLLMVEKTALPNSELTLDDFRPNNLWKMSINANIDTTIAQPLPMDNRHIELLGADTAVIFPIKLDEPYRDRYTYGKYVIANRDDNGGHASLLFFYHEDNAHLIDDEIERTWGMLKFRTDSLHLPKITQKPREN